MGGLIEQESTRGSTPPRRLDVELHDLLKKPEARQMVPPPPSGEPQALPEPVFPQHPELLGVDDPNSEENHARALSGHRRWTASLVRRASSRGISTPSSPTYSLSGNVISTATTAGPSITVSRA